MAARSKTTAASLRLGWIAVVCLGGIAGCSAVLGLDPLVFDDPVVSNDSGSDTSTADRGPGTDSQPAPNDAANDQSSSSDATDDGPSDAGDLDAPSDAPFDPDAAQCLFCDAACPACTTVLVGDGGTVGPLAVDNAFIYWVSATGVSRATKDGQIQEHFGGATNTPREVLLRGSNLYWLGANSVNRGSIDGGGLFDLATGQADPRSLTFSTSNELVFWGNGVSHTIGVANATFGDSGTFFTGNINLKERCVHGALGDVFFTSSDFLYRGKVSDGGADLVMDVKGCGWVDNSDVFFFQDSPAKLYRGDVLTGTTPVIAATFASLTGVPNPPDFGKTVIGIDGTSVYVLRAANGGQSQFVLSKAPRTGGGVAVDLATVPRLDRIATDSTHVYWPVISNNAIVRIAK